MYVLKITEKWNIMGIYTIILPFWWWYLSKCSNLITLKSVWPCLLELQCNFQNLNLSPCFYKLWSLSFSLFLKELQWTFSSVKTCLNFLQWKGVQYLSEEVSQFKTWDLTGLKVKQQRKKKNNLQNNLTESKMDCSVHIFLFQVGVKEAWQSERVQVEGRESWYDLDSVFQKLNIDFKKVQ